MAGTCVQNKEGSGHEADSSDGHQAQQQEEQARQHKLATELNYDLKADGVDEEGSAFES